MLIVILFTNLIYLVYTCSINFCSSCIQQRCYQCQYPYTLINGYCFGQACLSASCMSCNTYDLTWCRQCRPTYELRDGQCKIATYVIVAPIVILSIGILLCLLYCVYKIGKRRQRRIALEELYNQQKQGQCRLPVPTSSQILDNPDFIFKYEEDKNFCSICLEDHSNLITQCGHYFHADCFSNWISRQKTCPICNNKDLKFVIAILCMRCKKKYYHYETSMNFILQIKADSKKQCTYCILHSPQKVLQTMESHQMILQPRPTMKQQQVQKQKQTHAVQDVL